MRRGFRVARYTAMDGEISLEINKRRCGSWCRLDLCGRAHGSGGGHGSFAAEDGSGGERDDEADGGGLGECIGHVGERGLVELLRALYGSDMRGHGGRIKSGGLDLVNLRGEVAVHEVGHE